MFLLFFAVQALASDHFSFRYQPAEGAPELACRHEQIRDLPDWRVACGEDGQKKFTVHLVVREIPRDSGRALEILYWVTEPGPTDRSPPIFHSSTFWLRLKGEPESFVLSQGVENDYASLVLDWRPPSENIARAQYAFGDFLAK